MSARPTKRRRLSGPSLLSLPDEILSHVIAALPPKPAFYLALTNTRLLNVFRTSFHTIDATTPFPTNTIYTPTHIHSLLRHTTNLTTLKVNTPLLHIPNPLPLRCLSFNDSQTLFRRFITIPTLEQLHIDSPLLETPNNLRKVIPNLSKLEITNIDPESQALDDIEQLLQNHPSKLDHLSLTIAKDTVDGIANFTTLISNITHLTGLQTFSCGIKSPEQVSRSPDDDDYYSFATILMTILSLTTVRPVGPVRRTKTVHVFTPSFEPELLQEIIPMASNADLTCSFGANSVFLPLNGRLIITELASTPFMYRYRLSDLVTRIPASGIIQVNLDTFNMVLRELATSYTPADKNALEDVITPSLRTLRVQIPFRSETNLNPIARNITDVMDLSKRVERLDITREIVHFIQEQQIASLMSTWGRLKHLYLTAPENYGQDPYPEMRCVKYSAWCFLIALPKFLAKLPTVCPNLETLLLEEIGCMGEVENPGAMTGLIAKSLNAVENFEHALPSVDAGTVRGQLLVWRSQFL